MPVSAPSPSSSRPAVLGFAARYPWVLATLVVVALTLGLHLAGAEDPARWIASAYALVVAAWTSVGMVRDLMRGHWGVDVLAVTAIVATVLVGEHLAAVLAGPDRPTWLVVAGRSIDTWGVDASVAERYVEEHYELVGEPARFTVYHRKDPAP